MLDPIKQCYKCQKPTMELRVTTKSARYVCKRCGRVFYTNLTEREISRMYPNAPEPQKRLPRVTIEPIDPNEPFDPFAF